MQVWFLVIYGVFLNLIISIGGVAVNAGGSSAYDTDDMFESDDYTCALIDGKWLAGELKRSKFTPYKTKVSDLAAKIKKASPSKKAKLTTQKKKFQLLNKNGNKVCKKGPPSGNPTPTPTPGGGGSTPAPKPSPTPVAGCFDSQGNTKCFGIGSAGQTGNVSRGKNIWERGNGLSTSCIGCHSESAKRNRTYSQVMSSFSRPEMFGIGNDLSSGDVADITAYLNRFNP
ncbi:MAG: hypothetical protein J5J00_02545 [Deltaproteobacteria bacterium]|nr:hypothetical protein [Deltaproteobacteria bacterium]